jgi:hypothetical protein
MKERFWEKVAQYDMDISPEMAQRLVNAYRDTYPACVNPPTEETT